jgi:hypothetical protein
MLGAGMVLQEQIVAQQVKQFLAFYVIWRLILVVIWACQVCGPV